MVVQPNLLHLLLLLLAAVLPPTEAIDRQQSSTSSTTSTTKETPLRAMLHPDVNLLPGNSAMRLSPLLTAKSLQTEEKEDHPQPVQHQFDRATSTTTTTAAAATTTTHPSDHNLGRQFWLDVAHHNYVAHQFKPAKGAWDWVPFSTAWNDQCKADAAVRQADYDAEKLRLEAERSQERTEDIQSTLGSGGDTGARPTLQRQNAVRGHSGNTLSGNLQRQNRMHASEMGQELRTIEGGVAREALREKVLAALEAVVGLTEVVAGLPALASTTITKKVDDFKYMLRCQPWKTFELATSAAIGVVGLLCPPAAVALVVVGLVKAAVLGLIEAAEEPCKEGAEYVFVKTAVVQTGLAMVGIPVGGSMDAAADVAMATLFAATDEAMLVIAQIEYGIDAMEMIKADSFRNFKCSCGTVNVMQECIPTEGPTNPLYRLKELAKTFFKTGEEDDDEFSDALDGTEDGGEVVDDEVYHDTMSTR